MDLIGDIGGTFARFAFAEGRRYELVFEAQRKLFPEFHSAIEFYFEAVRTAKGGPIDFPIDRAAFAWASPIVTGRIVQLGWPPYWKTSLSEFKLFFGLQDVIIVNDIIAIARSIPLLEKSDFRQLNEGHIQHHENRIVIVPGTAFGAALCIWDGMNWSYLPSDAGLAPLAMAKNDRERQIFAFLQSNFETVTASTLICGPGLRRLYEAIGTINGQTMDLAKSSLAIIEAAIAQDDAIAIEAVTMFLSLLWRMVESISVTVRASCIYFSGTLCRKLGPLLVETIPDQTNLRNFQISLIEHEHPAFLGLQDALIERKGRGQSP